MQNICLNDSIADGKNTDSIADGKNTEYRIPNNMSIKSIHIWENVFNLNGNF